MGIASYFLNLFLFKSSWATWIKLIAGAMGLTIAISFYLYYNDTQGKLAKLNQEISKSQVTIALQDNAIKSLNADIVLKDNIQKETLQKFQDERKKIDDQKTTEDKALNVLNELLTKHPELTAKLLNDQADGLNNCLSLYSGKDIKDIEPDVSKRKKLSDLCGLSTSP